MNNVAYRYFSDCQTEEQLKAKYRTLSRTLHPDAGGDDISFARMSDEYVTRCSDLERERERRAQMEKVKDVAVAIASTYIKEHPEVRAQIKAVKKDCDALLSTVNKSLSLLDSLLEDN